MSAVIKVEGVSKKYIIKHQLEKGPVAETLNDALIEGVKTMSGAFLSIFKRSSNEKTPGIEDFYALKDINFEVKDGERLGIIGKNGAGKSTLLKILSRITHPTDGRVSIRGRVASLLEVGTGFHGELTGRENIYMNGSILGMSREEIKKKFDAIVDFSGVEKFLDTPVKRYSSGMNVRLAFAVAAHLEPEILIIDEVLAVGDYEFQKRCLGKMEDSSKEGRTILFVSHNMEAITSLCERAILLHEGSIQMDDVASDVVGKYYSSSITSSAVVDYSQDANQPGDETIRFIKAAVYNNNGEIAHGIAIDEPFSLTLEYEVLRSGYSINSAIGLQREDNTVAFWATDAVVDRTAQSRMEPGVYKSRCVIPPNFLNNGTYFVTIALNNLKTAKTEEYCVLRQILQFHIIDPIYGVKTRGLFVGPFPGSVRPLLEWDVSKSS